MELRIRRATLSDLDAIMAMEDQSFSTPWSRDSVAVELREDPRRLALLAEADGAPAGYALVWIVADELHLVSVAVAPPWRRRGIAHRLLEHVLEHPSTQQARLITLEVREGNVAARKLYEGFGFQEVALRPRYYPDTGEDAVVMLRALGEGPGRIPL